MSEKTTSKPSSPLAYDTRVLARNVEAGAISREELDAHLAALPDAAGKSEPFLTRLHGNDLDEDDLDEMDESQGDEG